MQAKEEQQSRLHISAVAESYGISSTLRLYDEKVYSSPHVLMAIPVYTHRRILSGWKSFLV